MFHSSSLPGPHSLYPPALKLQIGYTVAQEPPEVDSAYFLRADYSVVKLPQKFVDDLNACGDDADAQFEVGVEFATRQTADLLESGVPGIHFYVLNKSEATSRVLTALNWPAPVQAKS